MTMIHLDTEVPGFQHPGIGSGERSPSWFSEAGFIICLIHIYIYIKCIYIMFIYIYTYVYTCIYIYMCFFTCYLITGVITYHSATNWDEPPSGGFLSHGATPQIIPSKNPGCCLLMFISLNQLLSYPHFRTPPSRSFLWRCPKAQVGWPQLLCCAWNTLGLQLVPRAGPNFTKPMSYHHSPQLSTVKSVNTN
jgi:hypothetical protein